MSAKLLLVLVGIAAIAGLAVLSLPAYEEEQSAAQVIKEHPRVQAFYKEHPDARFALQRFSKNQIEREEPRIAQECKEPLEPGKYYRAELESRDELNHLILWVDQNTYYAYCITDTPANDQPPKITPATPADDNAPQSDQNTTIPTPDQNTTPTPPTPAEPTPPQNTDTNTQDTKHEPLPQITDVNAQPAEPEIAPSCTDSDGNVNYYEQGTLTWENATGNGTETDTCLGDTQLQEYYCKGSGVGKLSVTCPVGNTCQDGLCFPPPPDPPACNNNILDIGEECDMEQLGGQTCQTLGFASGTLTCNTECTFDTAACNNCGNGVCDAGENPDTCASDCTCGNGAVNIGEQCDGEILPAATCAQYDPQKYYAGEMTCTPQCTYDTTACQTWCGNGTCDVSRGETVTSCSTDCKCGNGVIDTGEQCEPKNMPYTLCADLNPFYASGTLSCKNDCTYNTTQCVNQCGNWVCDPGENANNCDHDCNPTCQNNVIEQGEQCDGTALGEATCQSKGFDGGTISCTGSCTLNTSACYTCGDGHIGGDEQCDGTNLAGQTCNSLGYYSATLLDSAHPGGEVSHAWGDGSFVYAANEFNGLKVYSVDGSGKLTLLDSDNLGGRSRGVWSDGSFVYLTNSDALVVYSADGSGQLTILDSDATTNPARRVWGDGSFIYVVTYLNNSSTDGLKVYSVDGSGQLTQMDSHDPGGEAWSVWGDDSFIYVADGFGGLVVYTVDESGQLTQVDSHDLEYNAYGVWGDDSFIYVADGSGGLVVYTVDEPGQLTRVASDSPGGQALSVWGDGSFVYLSDGSSGFHVYTMQNELSCTDSCTYDTSACNG